DVGSAFHGQGCNDDGGGAGDGCRGGPGQGCRSYGRGAESYVAEQAENLNGGIAAGGPSPRCGGGYLPDASRRATEGRAEDQGDGGRARVATRPGGAEKGQDPKGESRGGMGSRLR